MSDRREFLKLFGIGCTVVPIIGGVPVAAAEAKLIEIPKLEPVKDLSMLSDLQSMQLMSGPMGITVTLDNPIDGKRITLHGKTFVTSIENEVGEIKDYQGKPVFQYHHPLKSVWRMEGQFIIDEKGHAATLTQEMMR